MEIHDLETLRIILYEAIIKKDDINFSINLQKILIVFFYYLIRY